MIARLAADLVLVVHAAFVLFVVLGGLAALRWPRVAWLHLPAALWGVLIEWCGWVCPLTPLEKWLRRVAGQAGYEGGFIEHYVVRWLYPPGLDRRYQVLLGLAVLLVNGVVYAVWACRWRQRKRGATG
ncbi:MAG: DUF2784 domain-containing protein [Pirellulales bacterium]|nr:DUF2784 domain-containing protein [Pirellulales bacterium]